MYNIMKFLIVFILLDRISNLCELCIAVTFHLLIYPNYITTHRWAIYFDSITDKRTRRINKKDFSSIPK